MLGEKIRNFRKNKSITIQEMADSTGLSIGYISQVERNLVDPSLSSLRKISAALDIPTYLLMEVEKNNNDLTIRKDNILIMKQPKSTIEYHCLTPMPDENFIPKSLVIRFKLNANSKDGDIPVVHESEEIIMVEKGNLIIHTGDETVELMQGDSTIIKGNIPHIVENKGDEEAVAISIFTPALWKFPYKK
ncbi:helix-turn-helix domain-containing protein [Terrisporobacter glycolicus]|uniref:HTH cro/C1-type domain-containing protein n=1 Tax=Terrisporobacter glycolicus ATCC 14880 = DSM 1288 TaxID=1121315 RepID=A0ABZ2EVT3_9FIRM|nr:XRE family transcriptional regulator [Terrisporobacter glycolicus]